MTTLNEKKMFDKTTEEEIRKAGMFHDAFVLNRVYQNLPEDLQPIIGVHIRTPEDLEIAKSVEFKLPFLVVHYTFPDLIEKRADEIEKIFGYYNDFSKRTDDYEGGRMMICGALLKAEELMKDGKKRK